MPVLRGQRAHLVGPDVRGIGHDDIVPAPLEGREMVGCRQTHTPREAEPAAIDARERQRLRRDVRAFDPRPRQVVCAGERDAAAPGAQVEDMSHALGVDPGPELPLDELGERRARHEGARIDAHRQTRKESLPGEVGRGQTRVDALLQQRVVAQLLGGPQRTPQGRLGDRPGEPERAPEQGRRLVAGVVGAVPEENPGAREPPRSAVQRISDGRRRRGPRWGPSRHGRRPGHRLARRPTRRLMG